MNRNSIPLNRIVRRTLTNILGAFAIGTAFATPLTTFSQPASADHRWEDRDQRTLNGVVVDDTRGRDFVMRTDRGDRVRVRLDEREPRRLNAGDEVRVTGYYYRNDRDTFWATNLQIVNNRNDYRSFTGRVTNVESDQKFDLRTDDKEYNVYTRDRLPRRLNRGDYVRVYGVRTGNNGIRYASVTVLNNDNSGDYRTFTGRVTDIDSDQKFDLLADGKSYDVYTRDRLPRGLNRGDSVRVYGVRTGNNGIRNATVTVTNDSNYGNYRTFIGEVVDVDSDYKIDVKSNGQIFNVTSRDRLPSRISRGNYVRVAGTQTSRDDIRDASVLIVKQ